MSQLNTLIQNLNKQYKEDLIVPGATRIKRAKIPFTSPRANYMLYGGIPRGKIVEFAGEENGGKTTTALDVVANAQRLFAKEHIDEIKQLESVTPSNRTKRQIDRLNYLANSSPRRVFYADCENTLDDEWAQLLGVDISDKTGMLIMKPMSQTAEQIFDIVLNFIESGEIGLVVIDSLGVMLSAQAYEKSMEEKTYGGIAMALTLFSKKAEMLCAKYDCTLIGINQMREDMNSTYGGLTTTGGKAWKHNCSVRIMFQKGDYFDENGAQMRRTAENPTGNYVMMSIAKTKVCKPDRKTGFYTLKYATGIDDITDTVETAMKYGMIMQAGAWFSIVNEETGEVRTAKDGTLLKFQGRNQMSVYLKTNDVILNELKSKIYSLIEG